MKRLPHKNQILPVYAVGVTILYTWTIIITLRDTLFNWVLYFNSVEILILFAYLMVGALLESLCLIVALTIIGWALPRNIFSEKFVSRGVILTSTFLCSIMYYYTQTPLGEALMDIYKWGIFFAGSTFIFILIAEFFRPVERVLELIADRSQIFLYIYLPISFLSIIVIVIRNIG